MSLVYPCIAWLEIASRVTVMPFAEDFTKKHLRNKLVVLVNL